MRDKDPMRGAIMPHYVGCALWSSTDDDGEPLDDGRDVSPETLASMRADCAHFFFANRRLIRATGASLEQTAHDFWLTRNHHGAGFWDRGYRETGRKLTDAAHAYGSVDLYVGDDGFIYS